MSATVLQRRCRLQFTSNALCLAEAAASWFGDTAVMIPIATREMRYPLLSPHVVPKDREAGRLRDHYRRARMLTQLPPRGRLDSYTKRHGDLCRSSTF